MKTNPILSEWRHMLIRNNSMVMQLILFNVLIFLIISLIRLFFWLSGHGPDSYYFKDYLGVPSDLHQLIRQPWTLITYMFTHGDLLHILFNMLVIYWFGTILAEFAGKRKILPLYLLGGLAGALLYIASYQLFPVFSTAVPEARAWGASASAMALMVAAATLVPDYTLFLLLIGPVRIKWIALITIIIDLISIPASNAGGHIAHLGGAAFGFIFIRQLQQGRDLSAGLNWCFDQLASAFRKKTPLKVSHRNQRSRKMTMKEKAHAPFGRQERLDTILDKIALSGYDSLTKEEKEFLFLVSKEES